MEEPITLDKPFMTYKQQINKLIYDKGLTINDIEYAVKLLKNHSYFDLISGYKDPFKKRDGNYKLHTSIEDIYALYCFDDTIRAIFLKYILIIEKKIKSLISYSFCEENGENQSDFLNVTNYNYTPQFQDAINKLVSKLQELIDNPKNYSYISHQKRSHGNVPLWVLMKALTLGTVSKMYSFLPQKIQYKVSKEFDYISEGMLVQMLDLLARVRHVCAHNERLYDYKYQKSTIDNTLIHELLSIPKRNEQYIKGKKDLFAVVIVFKYMLDIDEFENFILSLDDSIKKLFASTKVIQKSQLFRYMGFPDNWKDILDCDTQEI